MKITQFPLQITFTQSILLGGNTNTTQHFDKLQDETWFCRTINLLNLNKNKTGIILFGQTDLSNGLSSAVGPLASYCHPVSWDLGVIFDSAFDKYISTVVKNELLSSQAPW